MERILKGAIVLAAFVGALVGALLVGDRADSQPQPQPQPPPQFQPQPQPHLPHAPTTPTLRQGPTPRVLTPLESDVVTLQNTVKQQGEALTALTARVPALETRMTQAESKLATHESKIALLCQNQLQLPFALPGVKLAPCG